MKHVAFAAAAMMALAAPASAVHSNCDEEFKAFWDELITSGAKQLTGQQLADISRQTIRGYGSCSAGDGQFDARSFFDKLAGQYGIKLEKVAK